MTVAEGILCNKTHQYILEKNGMYYIGLTDYFIDKVGEIVFLELPEIGSEFLKNEVFGTIQGVNSSIDMYMPIGGTVVEVNEDIVEDYDRLHETSWLLKVKSSSASEDSLDLYDYDDYLDLI